MINRLGFNNGGHAAALARLEARKARGGIVGVKHWRQQGCGRPHRRLRARFEDIQSRGELLHGQHFLAKHARPARFAGPPRSMSCCRGSWRRVLNWWQPAHRCGPSSSEIAPDIAEEEYCSRRRAPRCHKVDGVAVSNTTLSRAGLAGKDRNETGGLSGRPMFKRATIMLAKVVPRDGRHNSAHRHRRRRRARKARAAKIEAGATLLQLYTGLVYDQVLDCYRRHQRAFVGSRARRGRNVARGVRGRKAGEWANLQSA